MTLRSSCLYFLSAEVIDVHHHTWCTQCREWNLALFMIDEPFPAPVQTASYSSSTKSSMVGTKLPKHMHPPYPLRPHLHHSARCHICSTFIYTSIPLGLACLSFLWRSDFHIFLHFSSSFFRSPLINRAQASLSLS